MKNLFLLTVFIFSLNCLEAQEKKTISNKSEVTKVKSSEKKNQITPSKTIATKGEKELDIPDFMKNPYKTIGKKSKFYSLKATKIQAEQMSLLTDEGFELKRTENGFNLYQDNSSQLFAELRHGEKDGYFIYLNPLQKGTAHFNKKGDLIVIYFNPDTGQKEEILFKSN